MKVGDRVRINEFTEHGETFDAELLGQEGVIVQMGAETFPPAEPSVLIHLDRGGELLVYEFEVEVLHG